MEYSIYYNRLISRRGSYSPSLYVLVGLQHRRFTRGDYELYELNIESSSIPILRLDVSRRPIY